MEDLFYLGVKALIYNKQNKVLILQKNNTSSSWDLPGGRIETNESLEQALRREVKEETSISDLSIIKFLGLHLTTIRVGNSGLIFALHLCQIGKDSPIILSSEHTNYTWATPDQCIHHFSHRYPSSILSHLKTSLTKK